MGNGIGDEAFQYDNAGRLIRHTQWGDQPLYFDYDSAGNRTVMIGLDGQLRRREPDHEHPLRWPERVSHYPGLGER
jgi:YD repeat-containing protein